MLHSASRNDWNRHYTYASTNNKLETTELPGDPSGGPYSATYDHDARGNMIAMPHLSTIGWDWADRMQTADLGGGGDVHFTYDSSGQRVRKVWDKTSTLRDERIYLGGFEIFRSSTSSVLDAERETLHVMDDRRRIAMVETLTIDSGSPVGSPTSRQRYQLGNQLESVAVEVTEDGDIIGYEEFYPFGATCFHSKVTPDNVSLKRYRYTGKERDEETGLYYHGARYYAAWLGKWTAIDSIGWIRGGDINRYAYVRNRTTVANDPSGRNYELVIDNKSITVFVTIEVQRDASVGSAPPAEQIKTLQNAAQTYFGGTFKNVGAGNITRDVKFMFDIHAAGEARSASNGTASTTNKLSVRNLTPGEISSSGEHVSTVAGTYSADTIVIPPKAPLFVIAHEFGHALGLPDDRADTAAESVYSNGPSLMRGNIGNETDPTRPRLLQQHVDAIVSARGAAIANTMLDLVKLGLSPYSTVSVQHYAVHPYVEELGRAIRAKEAASVAAAAPQATGVPPAPAPSSSTGKPVQTVAPPPAKSTTTPWYPRGTVFMPDPLVHLSTKPIVTSDTAP